MRTTLSLIALLTLLLLVPAAFAESGERGVLIWFYALETNDSVKSGEVREFTQTAGASFYPNIIHHIAPLSPQSEIVQDKDDNWYLQLAPNMVQVKRERPLFLGQILDLTTSGTHYGFIRKEHNIPVSSLIYPQSIKRYLLDRRDLQIHHEEIQRIRDTLLAEHMNIIDYIVAVDRFVHNQLHYEKPARPNTAVDLLSTKVGWCGEYAKLKQALLRSAGIATRDVYVARTGTEGPAVDENGDSKAHVWLQVNVPDVGWVNVPSTRRFHNGHQFVRYRGGHYVRAIDLYKHPKETQRKRSSGLKRSGGIRGNGMFFKISSAQYPCILAISQRLLDYGKPPPRSIVKDIGELPSVVQPLFYWFLISAPDKTLHTAAVERFVDALETLRTQNLQMFYTVSPSLVKSRLDQFLTSY